MIVKIKGRLGREDVLETETRRTQRIGWGNVMPQFVVTLW